MLSSDGRASASSSATLEGGFCAHGGFGFSFGGGGSTGACYLSVSVCPGKVHGPIATHVVRIATKYGARRKGDVHTTELQHHRALTLSRSN